MHEAQARLKAARSASRGGPTSVGRGILAETWQAWGVGYATPQHPRLEEPRPAICLPWQGKGTVKAVQYRFFGDGLGHGDRFAQTHRRRAHAVRRGSRWPALRHAHSGGGRAECPVDLAGDACGRPTTLNVVSFGSDSNATNGQAPRLAARYRRVIIWADDEDKLRAAMEVIPGAAGRPSPTVDGVKLDANALLPRGMLADFIAGVLPRWTCRSSPRRYASWGMLPGHALSGWRRCSSTGYGRGKMPA